jgi:iron-sulfur cluster repair protein YtfE (RIC family)
MSARSERWRATISPNTERRDNLIMLTTEVQPPHASTSSLSVKQALVIQQTKVESQALEHITQAVEVALAWVVEGDDVSRKLSSVRFFTEMYQRHLERLFALEEVDGYMDDVTELSPELTNQVDQLKPEHEQFRVAIRKIVLRLDRTPPVDCASFNAVCEKLRQVIKQVLEHTRRENELFVESIQQDTGGSG